MQSPLQSRTLAVLAALTIASIAGHSAKAQSVDIQAAMQTPQVQAAIAACGADRNRLCATVIPGGGRIVKCLAAVPDQLSPACKQAMLDARDALKTAGILLPEPAK